MLPKVFNYLEEALIVAGMAFMTVMNFINVVSRYYFANSFSFTEELTITTFVWVSMLGIAAGFKRMSHLGMDYFVKKFPREMQIRIVWLSMLCSLAMAVVMIVQGIGMVEGQIMLGAKTPALQMPLAAQGLAIPVGGTFIAIRILTSGWAQYKAFSGQPNSTKET